MSDTEIAEEAVNEAARVDRAGRIGYDDWETAPERSRLALTRNAHLMLEAALPALRRQWAEEVACDFDDRVKIAQRVSELERSGVREGMIVAWIAAAKATREYGETKP